MVKRLPHDVRRYKIIYTSSSHWFTPVQSPSQSNPISVTIITMMAVTYSIPVEARGFKKQAPKGLAWFQIVVCVNYVITGIPRFDFRAQHIPLI